ncbi:hypothetical protein OSTOST_23475, partial [Ostertagia ostertagi]
MLKNVKDFASFRPTWAIRAGPIHTTNGHSCAISVITMDGDQGRSPLSTRNSNLTYGSLDDCIEFALKCRNDALEIHGSSMRLFSGSLKTKRLKEVACERTVTSSYHFSVFMPYEECGIEKKTVPYPSYSGLIHVKEGSTTLVTIRDKLLQ